ncbi:MAG: ABC transporter permease [Flavobacteriales bacterium]|nr:ABC transporter permease [Flavobacteriales bacterium]
MGYFNDSSNWREILSVRSSHIVLPIITLSYGSIAFIYQQLKSSIQQQLTQDYILTAKAKGLSTHNIKWRQLFKNVSFPLITILGNLLPALISGSFIVEYIFSIPGMGKLSVDAFMSRDFGMVYAVLMLSSFLGMFGILLTDLLYYKLDPRVQLHESNTKAS